MPRPFIVIELDRPRRMRFGLEASIEFEQLSGKKLAEVEENMDQLTLAQLLWSMLRAEDETLTFKQALKLVDEHASLPEINQKVNQAIAEAYGVTSKNPKA